MRTFCTEGPVDPERNYFVPRTALVAEGMRKVDQWRYFTIFAPRQSGKTTFFQFLVESIRKKEPSWLPLWLSFESYGNPSEKDFLHAFSRDTNLSLSRISSEDSFPAPRSIEQMKDSILSLLKKRKRNGLLIIDEVEDLQNEEVLNRFLHLIRSIYHQKEQYQLRSVILTGVSNITGILQDTASPFNIADQIDLPYFTRDEVFDLLSQHEQERGQVFEETVKEGIYTNTLGQPGLVNALARDLVEKKCSDGQRVDQAALFKSLDDFTRVYIDKNISNILSKAKQHPELMKQILFGQPVLFDTADDQIAFLHANGVIEDCDGTCCIQIPLYKKRIYNAFKPLVNGEARNFIRPFDNTDRFWEGKRLNMVQILHNYADYLSRRGNILFKGSGEGQYHYNLDAYLQSIAKYMDAKVYPEVVEGGGRVDLLVIQGKELWIIEVKEYTNPFEYRKAFDQILRYLENARMDTGYLLFFSRHHEQDSYETKVIEGKTIHTWIICVERTAPSKTPRSSSNASNRHSAL